MTKIIYIDRPPRIQPELPFDEIEIPKPPEKDEAGFARLVQVGLPLITIMGYLLIGTLGGRGRNPLFLIPMALSVVASVGFSVYSYFREKKKRAEVEKAYSDRLVELNRERRIYHDMQRRFYRYNYPDLQSTFRIVQNARKEAEQNHPQSLRSETRLWERRVSDADFGAVRLGMGTLPSTVVYRLNEAENFEDPQVREAMKLEADSLYVDDIPVIVSFRPPKAKEDEKEGEEEADAAGSVLNGIVPVSHALGVAGKKHDVYHFARGMLAHFAVFHSPTDARLFILGSSRSEWRWAERLPHCQADEQGPPSLYFVDDSIASGGKTRFDADAETPLGQFLEGIRKTLAQRKIRLQDTDEQNKSATDPTLPFMLLVVDLQEAIYDEDSPLNLAALEADAAISILLEEGAQLGAAVVFLTPERSKIPGGCRSVLEIERTAPATNSKYETQQQLHFRYAEVGVNSFRYVGKADYVPEKEESFQLAEELSRLKMRKSFGANLANTVPFLELMGYNTLQDLQTDTWKKWQNSVIPDNAGWLRVKLGLMSGNKPRALGFSAKEDGVHGMVAGSTGSGKSELLISLITGMAITYAPSTLNFVLVDYKGGGAFSDFKDLPHCVDIVTNLEGDGVTRMFTAIQSEMERRQKLNAETGTKNIVEYRKKGLHKTHQPYPYLFIIIDEFAEMIADRSEYKAQLESITRVGRAQGVSLILAAQRPSGVTDQMRSNIKYRICLRVETPAESREMLRRSEAAFLPGDIPGRGYLQVGNDEIELIQVAYTGDRYIDPALANRPVLWPERDSNYNPAQDQEPPELYKAIINLLNDMAQTRRLEKQYAPWPEYLPARLTLSTLLVSQDPAAKAITSEKYLDEQDRIKIMMGKQPDADLALNPAVNKWHNGENGWVDDLDWRQYALRPVAGLVDNPYAARQHPLIVNLPNGHVVIFGASGWGKTTFLRSMLLSLMAVHSPAQLHCYVLDLGGRNFGVFKDFPHIGAIVNPDEEGYEERVEQLLRELNDVVAARKTLFNNSGITDFYQYNQTAPEEQLPAIVVVIDNFVEFTETFGNPKDNVESVLDKFVLLARQAKSYGIHFVATASRLNAMPNQIYSLFTERYTLKLTDPTEYRAVVGGHVADIGDIPGRGYTKIGHLPLSFQVALPLDPQGEESSEAKELQQLAKYMQDAAQSITCPQPISVDALPKSVLFRNILNREWSLPTGDEFWEALKQRAAWNWRYNSQSEHADWLKVILGIISGNRPRTLHLEAKKDGVHGLIAGGTGSGKSELLTTLITGLALNYDPSVLNFVLVDYKGGGAFQPFKNLPHCVDIITNLNQSAVKRMFTAINAEMKRRQALNTETGTKDIVEYRRKGLHLSREPYPHLFIIIDEYAEMISDNPEFRAELESITRVGRAQGVNLILAAQRPIGVSDQMRANIKLRICLRVEGTDTSREILRRSDAAFLPSGMPGRGYLQIGNENIELMQMAFTGEEYNYAPLLEGDKGGKKPKFFDVVMHLAREIQAENKSPNPRTPWPPLLPVQYTLSTSRADTDEYLDAPDRHIFTLGQQPRVSAVNPFVKRWLREKTAWRGMDWSSTAMRGIIGLIDDPYNARRLPLVVDFTKGHVIVFGASGWGKSSFMRTLVVSLVATHAPNEFQAHILDLGGRNLDALDALPHVGSVIMPDERGYEERIQQLLRELNDIVDHRKRLFSEAGVSTLYEYNSMGKNIQPAILVLVDNFAEYLESFGSDTNEDNLLNALIVLVRQAKAYGLHFIISANRLNVLNSKLYSLFTERFTLRLSDPGDYNAIVGASNIIIGEIPGRGYTRVGRQALEFQVAVAAGEFDDQKQLRNEAGQIRQLGKIMHLAGKKLYGEHQWRQMLPFKISALPKTSSYKQVLSELFRVSSGGSFVEQLKAAVSKQWELARSAEEADWLSCTLGITSGNRKRRLHFSAKTDGVHGMIAGGTGSGKSELLMTMIVGLALNHPPDILNFVLVDYKGGGAFKAFEALPHCVDIVTNLNKAAVDRMFSAINAEIKRRQKLNADTGTKDIIEYRRKGLHLNGGEAYPHLFIIIDEYAEMIDDNPDYRLELESITRVGRAQGINLVLASQRPKGVSDQMRANIKFRLCLRVEQADTSREMLRRPDAAFLPNGLPGRGYLQVGNDNLELIQVSYTGEKQLDDRLRPVLWPDRHASSLPEGEDDLKLYDLAVRLSRELSGQKMAPKPWPGFLPPVFSLQSTLRNAQTNSAFTLNNALNNWLNGDIDNLWGKTDWQTRPLRAIVGLLDDPAAARQTPLYFDLHRYHLAVFGDSGWGKTSLLRTIIVSLATRLSPDQLHVYVLDLGGRNFRSLETLPHLGAVLYADDESYEERLNRLLDKLGKMTEDRHQRISDAGVNTLYEYNRQNPQNALPAVLVAIDNFAELKENYEALVENSLMPLVRRSLSAGISFVVTGQAPNSMPGKLYNLFGERITFKQSNTDRYMDIVGRGAIEIDDVPGLGYIRVSRRPLLFQAALPVGIFDATGQDSLKESAELQGLGAQMRRAISEEKYTWQRKPDPVNTLPELVSLEELLARLPDAQSRRVQAALGLGSNLEPALFDLKRMGPHFTIVGPPMSGKTTVLYNWVFSLACRYTPQQVKLVLIDTQRRFMDYDGKRSLNNLPHVLASIENIKELEQILPSLQAECEALSQRESDHQVFIIIDNFDDFSEELEQSRNRSLPRSLSALARRCGRDGLHIIISRGVLDSSSEFRRRVQSANYGLALRSADAFQRLSSSRLPSGLQNRELNMGRGFIIKAGRPVMAQMASPYTLNGRILISEEEVDEEKNAQALDNWVQKICARYPQQKAAWTQPADGAADQTTSAPASASENAITMLNLLKQAMQQELESLKPAQGKEKELLTTELLKLDMTDWYNEARLQELLKKALVRAKIAAGDTPSLAQMAVDAVAADMQSLILEAKNIFKRSRRK